MQKLRRLLTNFKSNSLFVFITGASGAGKTTVLKTLEDKYPSKDISINYFDSIEVPSLEKMLKDYGSPEQWQKIITHEWIEKLSKINDKKLIFLEGQFNPQFLLEPIKKLNVENYLIICLHTDKELRDFRLKHIRKQPELASADMDKFAEFLKEQTLNINGIVINPPVEGVQFTIDRILDAVISKLKQIYV